MIILHSLREYVALDSCAVYSLGLKMPSETKALLTAQTEKPNHYSYLKEFRVEQCTLFLQHKCTQHRPFTCFHWHFMNQRRRRPVRKRDGTFNYSADNYCTKYDETTGLCPEGDDCPFLHRTAGDTERRYHLRYYKTCMCVHDTDSRGYCVKNGPHCAFAHGNHDLRPPVYDIKEIQALENPDTDSSSNSNGPNVLDKERNLMNEDPKWQDTNCVLANYKTEPCKRPPRLCRQGYACPQYHNSRDKRRSPRKFKYRSTPCPNVKHGDEWGEPSNCENGDTCPYCHTRTEQQFHPEIYKSTKCNDVQQAGYCPRGVFCAFAHVDQEMNVAREVAAPLDSGTSLVDILSNALPPDPSNNVGDKNSKTQESKNSESTNLRNQIVGVENDPLLGSIEKAKQKQSIYVMYGMNSRGSTMSVSAPMVASVSPLATPFYPASDTVESVIGNALEDLSLDEPLNVAASVERDLEADSPTVSRSISDFVSSGILGSSAPVNIPGSSLVDRKSLGNFSPSMSSPLQALHSGFLSASAFSHHDSLDSTPTYLNHSHIPLSSSASKIGSFPSGGFYDFSSHQNMSPSSRVHHPSAASPLVNSFPSLSPSLDTNSFSEIHRLREELNTSKAKLASCDDRIGQASAACEAWKREAEESSRKASIAEQQRDEALSQVESLQKEVDQLQGGPHLHCLQRTTDLSKLSLSTLKTLQEQLRSDLDDIEKVVYEQTAAKCMVCEENNRTVLLPCNHLVLCDICSKTHRECPYCSTQILQKSTLKMS